jgi:hypothetical protein
VPTIDELLTLEGERWASARLRPGGLRVLAATSMGGFNHGAVTEKALAIALTLRGAKVDIFLCDGAPGCILTKIGKETPAQIIDTDRRARCPKCVDLGRKLFDPLGLDVFTLSQLLTDEERAQAEEVAAKTPIAGLKRFTYQGWRIGEHALAGALRYYAMGELPDGPEGEGVARKFLKAAVLTAHAIDRLLADGGYDVVVANHGIYSPQGIIGEVARARGVRVVNWNPAYRSQCFVFSHGDTYHHTMISEDAAVWQDRQLTPEQRRRTLDYLRDRRSARGDWIWFNRADDSPLEHLRAELGLDERPMVVALTSVVWDACLHYESNAFESLTDWVLQTVDYFAARPDLQLVIRIHPAEVTGAVKSRDRMADAISGRFPDLPENVKVVPPESPLSTYSLLDNANAALVYSTKTGIEASALGVPVVVAGEAWIRNKGFTFDADTPGAYREILDRLPFRGPMEPAKVERALRYADHFFFRRMIELPLIHRTEGGEFEIRASSLSDLLPGRHAGLDVICEGIASGAPFIADDPPGPASAEVRRAAGPAVRQPTTTADLGA